MHKTDINVAIKGISSVHVAVLDTYSKGIRTLGKPTGKLREASHLHTASMLRLREQGNACAKPIPCHVMDCARHWRPVPAALACLDALNTACTATQLVIVNTCAPAEGKVQKQGLMPRSVDGCEIS